MPLMIATRLLPSPIHGLGLFAAHFTPSGAQVWSFDSRIDRLCAVDDPIFLDYTHLAQLVETYCCATGDGRLIIPGDDARFINHSDNPCLAPAEPGSWRLLVASRDIAAGEELTCDYELVCADVRIEGIGAYLSRSAG